jgi:hypothetical protein
VIAAKMLGEMVATSESFQPRELGTICAWVKFGGIECLYMTIEDIESGEGDATAAYVCPVLCLLGVNIELGFVQEVLGTFIAHDSSMARGSKMGWV